MLKIVYPICCGLDVHRDSVYACIRHTDKSLKLRVIHHIMPLSCFLL